MFFSGFLKSRKKKERSKKGKSKEEGAGEPESKVHIHEWIQRGGIGDSPPPEPFQGGPSPPEFCPHPESFRGGT